jgi:5-formyltetrahydrofolate cyclo-ligase
MTSPLDSPKALLRRQLRTALDALSPGLRQTWSDQICAALRQSSLWREARIVLSYAPLPQEPDISPLWPEALADGKILCLPRFDPASGLYLAAQMLNPAIDLAPGRYGVQEPLPANLVIPLNRLDLVLVPGLGFGPGGCRLGRGKGFYDRLLAGLSALKCGLGFDLQWSESIPQETCDVSLDCILTPGRGLVWSRPRF